MSRAVRNQSVVGSRAVAAGAVRLEEIRIALTFLRKGFMMIGVFMRKAVLWGGSKPVRGVVKHKQVQSPQSPTSRLRAMIN